MTELEHLVMKIHAAQAGGMGTLSTGEALAAALVLNRFDWLGKMGYTIVEAIDRIGPEWVALIPIAAKQVEHANAAVALAAKTSREESTLSDLAANGDEINVDAELVTYGNAPGYRDVSFTLDVVRQNSTTKRRLCIRVNSQDSETMLQHLQNVHRLAWEDTGPIDKRTDEKRPRWID